MPTELLAFPSACHQWVGDGGTGVGDGVGTAVAVGAGVDVTVGAGVGVTLGATVDPHAARPRAAIAVPVMVVRFISASAHSTGTHRNSYIRANASNASAGDGSAPAVFR